MANKRKSSRRKIPSKAQWYLHHKLAWVLLLGALSMTFISSLPDMLSAQEPSRQTYSATQQIPETAAPSPAPSTITTTGPLAVTAVIFIVAAAAGVTWHHYYTQKNNVKKPAYARGSKKLTPRLKTKSR